MRLKIVLLAVAVLIFNTGVLAQGGSQQKDPQYYHFLMQNCPGKKLNVTLTNGQKVSGICQAQLVDRVQITREGVTHDIPYTSIAKMNLKRSWFSRCFGQVKDAMETPRFFIYMIGLALTGDELYPF